MVDPALVAPDADETDFSVALAAVIFYVAGAIGDSRYAVRSDEAALAAQVTFRLRWIPRQKIELRAHSAAFLSSVRIRTSLQSSPAGGMETQTSTPARAWRRAPVRSFARVSAGSLSPSPIRIRRRT